MGLALRQLQHMNRIPLIEQAPKHKALNMLQDIASNSKLTMHPPIPENDTHCHSVIRRALLHESLAQYVPDFESTIFPDHSFICCQPSPIEDVKHSFYIKCHHSHLISCNPSHLSEKQSSTLHAKSFLRSEKAIVHIPWKVISLI